MTKPKPNRKHQAHDREPKFITDKRTGNLIVVYYPDPASDRRKFLSTRTGDLTAAKEYWESHRDRMGAVRRGHEHIATREQGAFTVAAALDLLVVDYKANDRKDEIGGTVEKIKLELGSVRVEKLDLQRILDARDAWAALGKQKATVNRYLGYVRRGIFLAVERNRVAAMPKLRWPRYNEKAFIRKGFVTSEELACVNAAEPWAASRDLNIWSFWTGMRHGESTALQWEDYDAPTFTIRLHGTEAKSGEGRVLPLAPGPLRDLITRREADRRDDCPFIFHHEGAPLDDSGRWKFAWERAGLPMRPVRPGNKTLPNQKSVRAGDRRPVKIFHDLRRTGVRNLVRALVAAGIGSPEKTAMLISGHKTRAIFDRYNIVEEQEAGTALAALTQYHERQTPPPAAPAAGVLAFTRRVPSTPADRAARIARRDRRAG